MAKLKPAELVARARAAREQAHAPYSGFRVGAALLASSGRVYSGCNVENSSYGLTICAERVALFKAVSEGETSFVALAIASDGPGFVPPCGACRQALREFCQRLEILVAAPNGKFKRYQLSALLPLPFEASHLRRAWKAGGKEK